MKYWFSTVNHGLKTYSKAFIWEGGGMVHLSWTLACLASMAPHQLGRIEVKLSFLHGASKDVWGNYEKGGCWFHPFPWLLGNIRDFLFLNLPQKAWCLSDFETLAHSVRYLLVWNKIFCDAPNISSTVVNIYQMGRGGWGTIFCIIGRLLSVCLIVTQTCRDGRESYKWAMPPTYDIWWLYKFRSTRKTKYKSLWKKFTFLFCCL